jgi:uncharacterized membrane protein YkoI
MRIHLAAAAAVGVTVLFAGGTAFALTGNDAPVPVRPAAVASGSGTSSPTISGAATSDAATSNDATNSSPTSSPATVPPAQPISGECSADEAAAIAVAHVGGGSVTKIEREYEHGRPEWKAKVVNGGREHDVRVDAGTRTITRTDAADDQHGDRPNDERGDDQHGDRPNDERGDDQHGDRDDHGDDEDFDDENT